MAKKKWVLQASVIGCLRRNFRRSDAYNECLNAAKREYYVNCKNGNKSRRVHFQCNGCKKFYPKQEVQVDHIESVVDVKEGFQDYNTYISRLYCDVSGLQTLCKPCHLVKTKAENSLRRKESAKKKPKVEDNKTKAAKKPKKRS